jgi:hypothetical protein
MILKEWSPHTVTFITLIGHLLMGRCTTKLTISW